MENEARPDNSDLWSYDRLKILIADDHAAVRQGLKEILHEAPALVSEAADGDEAVAKALQNDWDVIVLDVNMPGRNGLQVLQTVKREKPETPVLMLSVHTGDHYVRRSLRDGASGYLSKETAPEELLAAIQTALAGEIYLGQQVRHLAARVPL